MPQLHTQSMNFYFLFRKVRKKLSEDTAGFRSDLEIYSALNNAQLDIVRKSKALQKSVTVTTVSGTREYNLNDESFSDIIDIAEDGVTFLLNGSSYDALIYRTKKDLNREFPGWQGVSASVPQYYYYNKATKTIGLYPTPNASNAGAYLFIEGYYKPKVLLAGTATSSSSASQIVFPAGSTTLPFPSVTDDY